MKIGLTGVNATENPGPGLPVAKSLKKNHKDWKIFGLSYDIYDPGNFLEEFFDKSFLLPSPSKGWHGIFEKIKYIKNEHGLDVLIPNLDAELPLFIKYKKDLENLGIKTFLPNEEQFDLRDKVKLIELAKELSLPTPQTVILYTLEDLKKINEKQKLIPPFYVKGRYYHAYKIYHFNELTNVFNKIVSEWGGPILLQESKQGDEINIMGLGDGKGQVSGLICMKKLTTTGEGKLWTGVTIQHPALSEAARQFVKKVSWAGPFEMECILSEGKLFLIEINPRFPAWVHFATECGLNLPERLIHWLEGKAKEKREVLVPAGKLCVRYTEELVTEISNLSKIK